MFEFLDIFKKKEKTYPPIDLSKNNIPSEVLSLLNKEFCLQHITIPIAKLADVLLLAIDDPSKNYLVDDIRVLTGLNADFAISSKESILDKINKCY